MDYNPEACHKRSRDPNLYRQLKALSKQYDLPMRGDTGPQRELFDVSPQAR